MKLFGRKAQNESKVTEHTEVALKEAPSPASIVEEIHSSFRNAWKDILCEASILEPEEVEDPLIYEKGQRLAKLGFTSARESELSREMGRKIHEMKERNLQKQKVKKAVEHFSLRYPHKLITEEALQTICKKYGLIFGEVTHYKGEVPEKNLREMEEFKIVDEDKVFIHSMFSIGIGRGIESLMDHRTSTQWREKRQEHTYSPYVVENIKDHPLMIAAPADYFDLKNMEIRNYELRPEIKDPIVLCPVMYERTRYFLVITAWGEEAESVVNEKMN